MISTGCIKFKGEIEKYLRKGNHNFLKVSPKQYYHLSNPLQIRI